MRTLTINAACLYTSIPNSFIDGYLTEANPMYSVIYIYFYRHCHTGVCSVATEDVAESFGILETDVVKCLKYWEKTGLIRLAEQGENYYIEFVPSEAASVVPIPLPIKTVEQTAISAPYIKPVIVEARPIYTVDELELYKSESPEVAQLISMAEQVFGKLLNYDDLCVIFGLYDWLRLPLPVIELLLDYCATKRKLNRNYIEHVAIDWARRDIVSIEAAKEYIQMFSDGNREIMKALGRGGRAPATKEQEYIDKWLVEFAMPLPVVLEACDLTIMNTDKRVFYYCDKILTDWHGRGVASLDEANRLGKEFIQSARNRGRGSVKPTRFANFKQREWDFQEVERVDRVYQQMKKGIKGSEDERIGI